MATPTGRQGWLASMRVRILAVVVGLLLAASLGSILLLRAVLFEQLDDEVRVDLEQEAEEFRLLTTGNDPETGESFDGDLPAIFDVYFAREVPDEGESLLAFVGGELYESRRAQGAGDAEDLEPAIRLWLSYDEPTSGAVDTSLGRARYIAVPLQGQGQEGLFVVANFPEFERQEIDDAMQAAVTVQLLTVAVASIIGLALAGRVLRPLRSLATTARSISDTDLTQRIPVTGNDEASQIAQAFNDMLGRLEHVFTTQRRFLDDTSHELRAPLTVIRGHIELLDLDDSPAARRETIDLVTDEVDRMSRIVNDLFMLARAEHPDFLEPEALDLREVVHDVHRKATALASRDWRVDVESPVQVTADRHRLTQALLQLADNAVKHTHDGDVVLFGTATRDGTARLWVDDSGSGLTPEVAERVFQRFAASGSRRGAGLGLAIVDAIARAHGGKVSVVPRPGNGTRFEITLGRRRPPGTQD